MTVPQPAVRVGVLDPALLEVRRRPAVDWFADVRRRRDEEGEDDELRGRPAVVEAVVHVVIVALEQSFRDLEERDHAEETHGVTPPFASKKHFARTDLHSIYFHRNPQSITANM